MAGPLWLWIAAAVASAVLPALIFVVLYAWQQPHGGMVGDLAARLSPREAAAAKAASDARRARVAARAAQWPTCSVGGVLVPFELVERIIGLVDDDIARWCAAAVCRCWREASRGSVAPIGSRRALGARGSRSLAALLRAREAVGLELRGPARALGGEALRALLVGSLRPPLLTRALLSGAAGVCEDALAPRDEYDDGDDGGDDGGGAATEMDGMAAQPLEVVDASFTAFGDGCVRALLLPAGGALRELRLAHCAALSEHGLGELAHGCRGLEVLELRFCRGLVACVHLEPLLSNCARTLRELDLSGLPVGDEHVRRMATVARALRCVRLFGCARVGAGAAGGLLALPELAELDLGNCALLAPPAASRGAAAAALAAERAAELLARVAPAGAGAGAGAGAPCALVSLGLFRVATDELLGALALAPALAAGLRVLDVRGCARLSGATVEKLGALRALRVLELQASGLAAHHDALAAALPRCELRVGRARAARRDC
ncbi:hypothetical protein KFE25_005669 [Diacronema lutheri]|uniref:F-box domain-containing protein n=1 Tax=Diacronema lutheri TaxID=2081491 RepID=A0A8J5XT66_DIALT|nr:hypothetical protein KFE25_005669 [Diacronema lutheri]